MRTEILTALIGTTCDSFDTLSPDAEIPEHYVNDAVYVKKIGAYSSASAAASFNGFPPQNYFYCLGPMPFRFCLATFFDLKIILPLMRRF